MHLWTLISSSILHTSLGIVWSVGSGYPRSVLYANFGSIILQWPVVFLDPPMLMTSYHNQSQRFRHNHSKMLTVTDYFAQQRSIDSQLLSGIVIPASSRLLLPVACRVSSWSQFCYLPLVWCSEIPILDPDLGELEGLQARPRR